MFKFKKPVKVIPKIKVKLFDLIENSNYENTEEEINEFFEDNPIIVKSHNPFRVPAVLPNDNGFGGEASRLIKMYEYIERD